MTPEMETIYGQLMAKAAHDEGHRPALPKEAMPRPVGRPMVKDRVSRAIDFIKENPGCKAAQIAAAIGFNGRTVKDVLTSAKAQGLVHTIPTGRGYSGYFPGQKPRAAA